MSRASRPLGRRPGTKEELATFLIVCEGLRTETAYMNGVRSQFRLSTATVKVVGGLGVPLTLVKEAKRLAAQADYDAVWCIFDVEAPVQHPRLADALNLAEQCGFRCAISNPCFELWLLLHFSDYTAYVDNRDVQRLVEQCDCKYTSDAKTFDFTRVWPKHPDALRRADLLHAKQSAEHANVADRNPWTSVGDLVRALINLAPKP